ncbi:MAG: acetyl-CoA carboxylase biotin carboxyl carrier protein [Oscillospiraceae bacterium]|nr:acetyl-CoA carboxylase biotin carboxyl carrier protein [Oscillospiraceae bacterium]
MENNGKGSGFAIGELREMAQIVRENNLTKLAITQGEFMILMESKQEVVPAPMVMPFAANGGFAQSAPAAPAPAQSSAPFADAPAEKVLDGNVIKAPLVGTYYESSAPDKPPFVTIGQSVKKGDVLMIIESMKLMNEVQSDIDGTVTEILVKNSDPVEYDQPIMVIK